MTQNTEHPEEPVCGTTGAAEPVGGLQPQAPPGAQQEPPGTATVTISLTEYEELKTLATERDDYLQRLRRAVADYLNLQKRIDRIKEDAQRDALRRVTRQVVPLADSLLRALEVAERTRGAEQLTQGLQAVEKEFYAILQELGVQPIEAMGAAFDANYHEAVLQQPAEGVRPNTVIKELKKGFLLGKELLRPTQVVVSAPPVQEDG